MNIENLKELNKIKIKELWQLTSTKIQLGILEHRVSVRSRIKTKPLNFITIISLLPFFLGFYEFLNKNQQLRKILFEKSVPAVSIPTESLNWETFRYFNETKKDFLMGLENIYWSPNSLFLTKSLNPEIFEQEYFIASLNKDSNLYNFLSERDENSSSLDFDNNDNKKQIIPNFGSNQFYLNLFINQPGFPLKKSLNFSHVLQSFYLNLDEIPLKLDNAISSQTFPLQQKNTMSLDSKNLPFKETIWNKTKTTISLKQKNYSFFNQNREKINYTKLLSESSLNKKQLPAVSQFDINQTLTQINQIDSSSWIKKQTSFYLTTALSKEKLYFSSIFSTENDINELQEGLFDLQEYTQNDINDINDLQEVIFDLDESRQNNINDLQEIIFDLDESKQNDINDLQEVRIDLDKFVSDQDIFSFRRMSGYFYPDMNSNKLSNLLLHKLFSVSNKNSLKIIFPANPTFIKQYSFSNAKVPKFSIKTGLVNLKNWDQNKSLYNNLAVFLDLKNGLDWYTSNPVQKMESGFFNTVEEQPSAKEEHPFAKEENDKEINTPVLLDDLHSLKKEDVLKEKNLRFWLENYLSPVNPLIQSTDHILGNQVKSKNDLFFSQKELLVPFLTETQWKKLYAQNKKKIDSNAYVTNFSVNGISLPLVEVCLPKQKLNYGRLNFDLNPTLDYIYSPEILLLNNKQTTIDIKSDFFNQKYSSVSYKKVNSIFNQPKFIQKIFFDNWENFTFSSWLIVSQIGFAVLCFNFLKSSFIQYFNEFIEFLITIGSSIGILDELAREEIELRTGLRDKGFRILLESKKKFQNLAGIQNLLPEIGEIVWFLRNKGKQFSVSKNFPQGLLLLGPPGTGKTILAQAIAGEAGVPVVTLSGSSLVAPGEKGAGALKLEMVFQEARQLAPCIVFIDEIDSLAQKREGVMQNPMGGDEILTTLEPSKTGFEFGTYQTSFFKKRDQIGNLTANSTEFGEEIPSSLSNKIAVEITQQFHARDQVRQEQLTLLMQLLIELDGIQGRKGVIIIGATNRPESLDSAILRPGRFDKIIELGLPSARKRFEILKLYGNILGYDMSLSDSTWEYLSKRTIGYTAADLASIMNQSCIQAILNTTEKEKQKHSLTTIEIGIDRITASEIEKPSKKITNFFINRLAYHQAGKIVLSTILEYNPPTFISYLWPRRQNRRSLQILTNLQHYFFQYARRCELEHRIVGSYGGKAAEILFLENSLVNLSSYGLEDLSFAFVLICFTIEKWYMYSKNTIISQLTQIISNKNVQEFSPEKIEIFKELASSMELPPHLLYGQEIDISTHPLSQNFFSSSWWQRYISQELEFVERNFSDWYRLYLPNPEETVLNIEWSPPDEFYHRNLLNKQVTKNTIVIWNDLYKIARDYQVHSFVIQSFNKALSLIDQNREFLDKLVFELVKKEVLRQPEIEKLASIFVVGTNQIQDDFPVQKVSDILIVNNSLGNMSRRKMKNWIDFKDFEN